MAPLYGRTGHLTALFGRFRPGQYKFDNGTDMCAVPPPRPAGGSRGRPRWVACVTWEVDTLHC
jgi:hypothetical protein